MSHSRDWKEVVLDLRKSANDLRETHPDAALMRCRKATEAIILSIYEEVYGQLPDKYFPYEVMLAKLHHHDVIPQMMRLSLNTAQQWGNFGSHFQHEGPATPENVDFAMGPLDTLIQWRFQAGVHEDEDFEEEITSQEISEDIAPILPTEYGLQWITDAREGKRGYRCRVCGFRELTWSKFAPHKKETGHESVKCNICDEYIGSISKLNKHKEKTGHEPEYTGEPPSRISEYSIKNQRNYLIGLVTNAYELETHQQGGWVNLAALGARMKLIDREFKIKSWGAKKLSELIERGLYDVFEIRKLKIRHSGKNLKKPSTFEIKPIHLSAN